MSFFCDFQKVWNFQSSETSKILRKFLRKLFEFFGLGKCQNLPILNQKWTIFAIFGPKNLGQNNLKFDQEAIFY